MEWLLESNYRGGRALVELSSMDYVIWKSGPTISLTSQIKHTPFYGYNRTTSSSTKVSWTSKIDVIKFAISRDALSIQYYIRIERTNCWFRFCLRIQIDGNHFRKHWKGVSKLSGNRFYHSEFISFIDLETISNTTSKAF